MNDYTNLRQLLNYVEKSYQNDTMFNDKVSGQWASTSLKDYCKTVRKCAAALQHMGLKRGDTMAVISNTNTHWLILDLAIMSIGAVSVPMFPNVSMHNLEFQLKDSNIKFVYLSGELKLDYILRNKRKFAKIITRDPLSLNDPKILSYDELVQKGQLLLNNKGEYAFGKRKEINPNQLATIVYTSGSTGVPKGVKLSHRNLVSQLLSIREIFDVNSEVDTAVSFLPTAHVFERTVVYFYLSKGISTYFVPDIKLIANIIREVKPTMLTVVPRVLEKVYSKMVLKARKS
ncbi:MAG: AMP-binding protein, partial [Bacteroidales bacterium]|nr:AMP-binding protein [Bacteroidales bacterium]